MKRETSDVRARRLLYLPVVAYARLRLTATELFLPFVSAYRTPPVRGKGSAHL